MVWSVLIDKALHWSAAVEGDSLVSACWKKRSVNTSVKKLLRRLLHCTFRNTLKTDCPHTEIRKQFRCCCHPRINVCELWIINKQRDSFYLKILTQTKKVRVASGEASFALLSQQKNRSTRRERVNDIVWGSPMSKCPEHVNQVKKQRLNDMLRTLFDWSHIFKVWAAASQRLK